MNKKMNSRLKEVDFSQYNLREAFVNEQIEYAATLRDEIIFSNMGVSVQIKIPIDADGNVVYNNVDEYSNFVNDNWMETTEIVVPKFSEWRMTLSDDGIAADGTDGIYPLEVILPSKLDLPRDSRVIFNEYNVKNEKIAREWTVLSTQVKQLSGGKTYANVAQCVPSRKNTYNTDNVLSTNFFFMYKIGELEITTEDVEIEEYEDVVQPEAEVDTVKELSVDNAVFVFSGNTVTFSVLS